MEDDDLDYEYMEGFFENTTKDPNKKKTEFKVIPPEVQEEMKEKIKEVAEEIETLEETFESTCFEKKKNKKKRKNSKKINGDGEGINFPKIERRVKRKLRIDSQMKTLNKWICSSFEWVCEFSEEFSSGISYNVFYRIPIYLMMFISLSMIILSLYIISISFCISLYIISSLIDF